MIYSAILTKNKYREIMNDLDWKNMSPKEKIEYLHLYKINVSITHTEKDITLFSFVKDALKKGDLKQIIIKK